MGWKWFGAYQLLNLSHVYGNKNAYSLLIRKISMLMDFMLLHLQWPCVSCTYVITHSYISPKSDALDIDTVPEDTTLTTSLSFTTLRNHSKIVWLLKSFFWQLNVHKVIDDESFDMLTAYNLKHQRIDTMVKTLQDMISDISFICSCECGGSTVFVPAACWYKRCCILLYICVPQCRHCIWCCC